MHPTSICHVLLLLPAIVSALSIPQNTPRNAESKPQLASIRPASKSDFSQRLERRRGGGGHGSGGGGGGGGRGGGSGSSGGSSGSGGKGGGSGSSGSGGRTGTTSVSPSFGGGRSFPGGSTSSYVSGSRSPSGITPALLGGAALGFAAASLFEFGAYSYPYTHPYYYVDPNTHHNDSVPVDCLCSPYNPCGCDDTNNQTLITQMLQNSSVANVTNVNGSKSVVIDGTLPNGTTSAGASFRQGAMDLSGYWVMASIVAAMVWGL